MVLRSEVCVAGATLSSSAAGVIVPGLSLIDDTTEFIAVIDARGWCNSPRLMV